MWSGIVIIMKAQVAFEYIVVVTAVLIFIIPIWAYMATVSQQATQALSISQAQTAANRLVGAADLVHTQGYPAQLTIDVYIPSGVQAAELINTTIKFTVSGQGGASDVASVALGPLSGSLPTREGLYKFSVKSMNTYVNISY